VLLAGWRPHRLGEKLCLKNLKFSYGERAKTGEQGWGREFVKSLRKDAFLKTGERGKPLWLRIKTFALAEEILGR
jgi:hypothetical protein